MASVSQERLPEEFGEMYILQSEPSDQQCTLFLRYQNENPVDLPNVNRLDHMKNVIPILQITAK